VIAYYEAKLKAVTIKYVLVSGHSEYRVNPTDFYLCGLSYIGFL